MTNSRGIPKGFAKTLPCTTIGATMLTTSGCSDRLRRFRERMATAQIDAAAVTDPRDIYYLTGSVMPSRFPVPAFLWVTADSTWLVAPTREGMRGVDETLVYEWDKMGTMNPEHVRLIAQTVGQRLKGSPNAKRLGWQAETLPRACARAVVDTVRPDDWVSIDDLIADLQKRKDPDEVELLRRTAEINFVAYAAVQKAIKPGVNELEVLATAQHAAMIEAGERVYHDGDYQSGQLGGLARNRKIEAGELFIVDAQTCFHGYWSDHSRVFAVGGEPTQVQRDLYDHIANILHEAPSWLKPGLDGKDIYRMMDKRVREHPVLAKDGFIHHAGHAIGLHPHELPDLGRERGGLLEAGNVVTLEPGGYFPEARFGVRLENMFLITENGAQKLSDFPLNLIP